MNFLEQALDDFTIDENMTFFVAKFHQKLFFFNKIFEHVEVNFKSVRNFYRRDILKIIHDLFETINFTHIIIETHKRFAITLNQIIENHFDLKNQINVITSKMKNLNVIKKKLIIMKNFMSILVNFFNNMLIRLNNKRSNFNEFIFTLKNTRVSKISLSNAFKSYQNSIVSFTFFNFLSFKMREAIFKFKFFIKFFIDFFKCKRYKRQNCYLKNLHIKMTFVFRLFSRITI